MTVQTADAIALMATAGVLIALAVWLASTL